MASLGQKLRDERVRQGRDLKVIADQLRIAARYLEAIEAEEWSTLPGGFFNRSFIRQYSNALGFDAAEMEKEFTMLAAPEAPLDVTVIAGARDPRAKLEDEKNIISIAPLESNSGRFFDSKTGLAVAGLVLIVAAGGALSLLWDRVSSQQMIKKESPPAVSQTPATASTPQAVAQLPEQKQLPEQRTSETATMPTPAESPALRAAASSVPDGSGIMTLNIEATEKTWIEVSADGKRIFIGVLEPGESKNIAQAQAAKMLVGNAGGIAVRKGGQDIGPIGPRGQVRLVSITPQAVEITNPIKPKDPTT